MTHREMSEHRADRTDSGDDADQGRALFSRAPAEQRKTRGEHEPDAEQHEQAGNGSRAYGQ